MRVAIISTTWASSYQRIARQTLVVPCRTSRRKRRSARIEFKAVPTIKLQTTRHSYTVPWTSKQDAVDISMNLRCPVRSVKRRLQGSMRSAHRAISRLTLLPSYITTFWIKISWTSTYGSLRTIRGNFSICLIPSSKTEMNELSVELSQSRITWLKRSMSRTTWTIWISRFSQTQYLKRSTGINRPTTEGKERSINRISLSLARVHLLKAWGSKMLRVETGVLTKVRSGWTLRILLSQQVHPS